MTMPPSGVSLKRRIIEALTTMTGLLGALGFGGRREPPLPAPPEASDLPQDREASPHHAEHGSPIPPDQQHGGGFPHR